MFSEERGLAPETVKAFGLGISESGAPKGRIAIPIHNADGELVADAGRWPSEDPPGGRRSTSCRPSSRRARSSSTSHRVAGVGEIVMIESYFSVMTLSELGLLSAVALVGPMLWDEQQVLLVRIAATDETQMTAPRPRSTIGTAAAWVASSMDLRSTANTRSHSSSEVSRRSFRDSIPTLLCRMSRAP